MNVVKKEITVIETQIELSIKDIRFLVEILECSLDRGYSSDNSSIEKGSYQSIAFLKESNYRCIAEFVMLLDDFSYLLDSAYDEYEFYGINGFSDAYRDINLKGIYENLKMMKEFSDLYTRNTVLLLKE